MARSSWQPLLADAPAEAARAAIGAIAETLAVADVAHDDAAGVALFWAYHPGDEARRAKAVEALYAAIEELDTPALHGGLVGAAWALAHVGEGVDDALAQVDELLAEDPPHGHDLIDGLAGVITYWLARPRSPVRDAGLARAIELLESSREGATWRTPPEHLAPEIRARHATGVLDCGLAHGAPGPIAVLAQLDDTVVDGALAARARGIAADATAWLLAQRLPEGMPAIAGGKPMRLAWCYGDPGVSVALARTARGEAEGIARSAIGRDGGVSEPSWCHGAAGLAHMFACWANATGDRGFGDAARAWYARTLAAPRVTAPGLLDGAAGIGLVLLAAIGGEEPAWDRIFACDIP